MKNILLVCGTRPEIIKMAPVYRALERSEHFNPVLLHTGQHTTLASSAYEFFAMEPDHALDLERGDGSLADLSATLLQGCTQAIARLKPEAVLVHGDTSSAAMGALAAFYQQLPIGHVEAGLRTHDMYSPFPEEMNRSLIGRMARWHFAPTERSVAALRAENIAPDAIHLTGNTVIDAVRMAADLLRTGREEPFAAAHDLEARTRGHRLVLVTAHRRENWGEGLARIAHSVCDLLAADPKAFFVWPLHANPAVAQAVRDVVAARGESANPRLLLTEPLEYSALTWLLVHAWVTMTDSGGIQEEAAALGVPALVLRESTERPELIEAGGGVLLGTDRRRIVQTANELREHPERHEAMRDIVNPFGDGRAAELIAQALAHELIGAAKTQGTEAKLAT